MADGTSTRIEPLSNRSLLVRVDAAPNAPLLRMLTRYSRGRVRFDCRLRNRRITRVSFSAEGDHFRRLAAADLHDDVLSTLVHVGHRGGRRHAIQFDCME